ncbi:hypothetical protein AgCh_005474 [Apium graveolens]
MFGFRVVVSIRAFKPQSLAIRVSRNTIKVTNAIRAGAEHLGSIMVPKRFGFKLFNNFKLSSSSILRGLKVIVDDNEPELKLLGRFRREVMRAEFPGPSLKSSDLAFVDKDGGSIYGQSSKRQHPITKVDNINNNVKSISSSERNEGKVTSSESRPKEGWLSCNLVQYDVCVYL